MARFTSLPPLDTSMRSFGDGTVREALPARRAISNPQGSSTNNLSRQNEVSPHDQLASAAKDVAQALGISPSELGLHNGRASISSDAASSIYIRPADTAWTPSSDHTIEERLNIAVADTLGLDSNDIPRDESFIDLGGNQTTADVLRKTCFNAGLSIRTRDILDCKTIAELETCITPLSLQDAESTAPPYLVSPLQLSSPISTLDTSSLSSMYQRSSPNTSQPPSRSDSPVALRPKSSKRYRNSVEQVLARHSEVSKAVLLKPKAGPFEGQYVAVLTLSRCLEEGSAADEIKLLKAYFTTSLPAIRREVERKVSHTVTPKVWIAIERMPFDESGRINRRRLQTWVQNANHILYEQIMSVETDTYLAPPANEAERRVQKVVSCVLNIEAAAIGMNLSFTELGGDATTAQHVVEGCGSHGITLTSRNLLQETPLRQLTALASSTGSALASTHETLPGFSLSAIQRLYFHTPLGKGAARISHGNASQRFNQSVLLRLKKPTNIEDIRAAVEAVVGHHSMLRTRFRREGGSWSQYVLPEIESSYYFGRHTVKDDEEVEAVIAQAQRSIDIEHGVFEAHHLCTNDGHQLLYLVAHHLVTDHHSWRLIVSDLDELLKVGNLVSGRAVSFQDWKSYQQRRIEEMHAPSTLPFPVRSPDCDYWGVNNAQNTYGNTTASYFTLASETVSLLSESNRALRTETSDIFMAALLLSFAKAFRDRSLPTVWKQEHDRTAWNNGLDNSETVGWFTSLCPLTVDASPSDDMYKVLCQVKDLRRAIPDRGTPFFTTCLRDAERADDFASSLCPFELIFTFGSSMRFNDGRDSILEELSNPGCLTNSKTSDIGPDVQRTGLFEVSAAIDQGEATVKFLYPRESRHGDRIQGWIRRFERLLREAISRLRYQAPQLSMSDVLSLNLTYDGLTRLNGDTLPRLGIDVENIEDIFPVTSTQQFLLMNEALLPGSSLSQTIYELQSLGNYMDNERMCGAWQDVVAKHAALRTVFIESMAENGVYDQVILKHHSPTMLFVERDGKIDSDSLIKNSPCMKWAKGMPCHRLVVFQAPGRTILRLEISQAICDSISLSILFHELDQAYHQNEIADAPEVSYPEYLACVKSRPESIRYWRDLLNNSQPCHFPRLAAQHHMNQYEIASTDLDISNERLTDFAQKHNIDNAAVLRAGWALVLQAYAGVDNVSFAYQIPGRDVPVRGIADAVGSFLTTLVCSLAVHPTQFIIQLLLDSKRLHREALTHRNASISNIYSALKLKGRQLFNTCLSFEQGETKGNTSVYGKLQHIYSSRASEYDLSVAVDVNSKGNLVVHLGHRILTADQASSVARAFGMAIEGILKTPGALVKEVNLLSDDDNQQILAWNSEAKVTRPQPIHQLVANQAAQNSDIQAVCAWDGDLTYGELDELAVALANLLTAYGVLPGTPVPIIVDKSRWAVVAMLAVLNAGGVLVPVDAELPFMFTLVIKEVGAKIVLASESTRAHLNGVLSDVIFLNDEMMSEIAKRPVIVTTPRASFKTPACILFDANATKNPKIITYRHDALATACLGQGPALLINPSSRVMQLSSYSVDIHLTEIFTTLVHGGCICIPSVEERVTNFTEAAQRMNVNWTYLTPGLSRRLDPDCLPNIAVVVFQAPELDRNIFESWVGKAKVLLTYNASEACPLGLSALEVKDSSSISCIGSPFCGRYWIKNPHDINRLMPIGAAGELVIDAPALVSRNITNKRDGKQQSVNSDATQTPGRLLQTGHFARYRKDGQIELVPDHRARTWVNGRCFHPFEIEAKLRGCLAKDVEVVVDSISFDDVMSDSSPNLVAFLQFKKGRGQGNFNLAELDGLTRERLYLAKKKAEMSLRDLMPSEMAFVPVAKIPLTPSLDVDRLELQRHVAGLSRALLLSLSDVPNPHDFHAAALNAFPVTRTEERVRAIWGSVLGINECFIGSDDGFVSLGGGTDQACELVVACRRHGIFLSIVDVLKDLPLAELCHGIVLDDAQDAAIDVNRSTAASTSNTSIDDAIQIQVGCDPSHIEDVVEATSLQAMHLESGLMSRGDITYLAINISGTLDANRLENACDLLTAVHPILRTAFVTHNRQVLQAVLRSWRPEFQRYQWPSWRLNNLTAKLLKRDQETPIDFRQPVTRFWLLSSNGSSVLIIRLSRAQFDNATLPALLKDLDRAYAGRNLTGQRLGFCDLVRIKRQASINESVEYWRMLLGDSDMTQIVDQPTPFAPSGNLKTISHRMPTGSLHNLNLPFETILKGAWSIVLSNLSGSNDVVFGHLVGGDRTNLDQGVLGPVGNIVPVRTRIPDWPISPAEYFHAVQRQHLASLTHADMEFTKVIQTCTSWLPWTRFSTAIYHEDQAERKKLDNFTIGGTMCKLSRVEDDHQACDVLVKSMTTGNSSIQLSLTFIDRRVPSSFADELLKQVCSTISLLTSAFVNEPLTLKGLNDSHTTPRIPLPSSQSEAHPFIMVSPVLPDQISTANTIISDAWNTILGANHLDLPEMRDVPYFELWPSLIPAAELARFYTTHLEESIQISTEDVISHPTMSTQYEMIISKQSSAQNCASTLVRRTSNTFTKNLKRLTISPTTATLSQNPVSAPNNWASIDWQRRTNTGSSGSSVESMTNGSSQGDEEEPKDELSPLTSVTLANRRKSAFLSLEGKGKGKGSGNAGRRSSAFLERLGVRG